jgi:superfamily I DNA/RNA helicase
MLTKSQEAAAQSPLKETFVEAGPGCGKTKTAEARVAWLLDKGVPQEEIAVLTYTRQAAHELQSRLGKRLDFCGTFHSVFLKIIESELGYRLHVSPELEFIKSMPDERERVAAAITGSSSAAVTAARSCMRAYGTVDYTEILIRALECHGAYNEISHVIVDEAQDLDELQWELLTNPNCLGHATLWACGDSRQQIYQFRGGTDRFTNSTKHHYLSESFRCPAGVIWVANEIASKAGHAGNLEARGESGGLTVCEEREGPEMVGRLVDQLVDSFFAPSQIAVLCRYNATLSRIAPHVHHPVAMFERPKKSPLSTLIQFVCTPHSAGAYADLGVFWAGTSNRQVSGLLRIGGASAAAIGSRISEELCHRPISALDKWLGDVSGDMRDEIGFVADKFKDASLIDIARESLGVADQAKRGVNLMTIHSSKGREFPAVIIYDDFRRIDKEELRVAFVAFTRTQEQCIYVPGKLKEIVSGT